MVVAVLCVVACIADSIDPVNIRWEPEEVVKTALGVGCPVEVGLGGFNVEDICKICSEALP